MNIFLFVLSIVPGIVIALYVYFRDIHEKEPIGLLVISFIYGGISLFIALGITTLLDKVVVINENDLEEQVVHAFIFVALVEEFCKFIFVRGILYPNKEFNEPFDGIVYSVMIGMGFATIENIFYVMNGGSSTAIVRMFTAIPAHATFAILMGYFLGKAKFEHKREFLYSLAALVVATMVHGIYDYFLFISFVPGIWIWSFISLFLAFLLARHAMKIHSDASPFKPVEQPSAEDKETNQTNPNDQPGPN